MSLISSVEQIETNMTLNMGERGKTSNTLSWLFSYPLKNVDHPLKGLLKDKGCVDLIEELDQLRQYYLSVYSILYKMVKARNENDSTGGLANLGMTGEDRVIYWRTTRQLDRLVDNATNNSARYYLFNPDCEHYEIVHQAFEKHAPDLHAFYLAIDTVRSDLMLRLRTVNAMIRMANEANEKVLAEPKLKVKARRELAGIMTELNQRIEKELL